MTKRINWNDFKEATQQDLKRTYRLNDRELENAARRHLDGANATERREFYQDFYQRKNK